MQLRFQPNGLNQILASLKLNPINILFWLYIQNNSRCRDPFRPKEAMCSCHPCLADGLHTFIPHPGLRTNLTRGYESQAFQAIISRFICYSGFCGDSSLDQENWNHPSKIPSKSKINPQLKTIKSDSFISAPLLHNADFLNVAPPPGTVFEKSLCRRVVKL